MVAREHSFLMALWILLISPIDRVCVESREDGFLTKRVSTLIRKQ